MVYTVALELIWLFSHPEVPQFRRRCGYNPVRSRSTTVLTLFVFITVKPRHFQTHHEQTPNTRSLFVGHRSIEVK